jgi:hypothetical protein
MGTEGERKNCKSLIICLYILQSDYSVFFAAFVFFSLKLGYLLNRVENSNHYSVAGRTATLF